MQTPKFFNRLRSRTGIIAVSVFLNFSGFTLIIPVLPFSVGRYVSDHDVALNVSLIIATFALCSFVAAPVLGAFSDRFGRRPVLLLSLLGSAVGFAVFGVGGALGVLFLGRIIEGLTAGSISAMYAYVADTHAPEERGPAYGMLGAAGGLGFMLGPVAGGLLGQISLSAPLYVAAAVAVLNAVWVYFSVPESLPPEKRAARLHPAEFNSIVQLSAVLADGRLRGIFIAAFLFFGAATLMQSNVSVLLKDLLNFNSAAIGLTLLGVGLMDILSQGIAAPKLLPRFGERRVAIAGLIINGLGFALYALLAFAPSLPLLVAAVFVFTFGDGLFQPSSNTMISHAAPDGQQGRVQGANQAQQSIARMIGPLASAWLYGLSAAGPYIAGGMIVLAGAALLSSLRTHRVPSAKVSEAP